MILRIDSLQTAMPPPSDPDPVGASAVQERGLFMLVADVAVAEQDGVPASTGTVPW